MQRISKCIALLAILYPSIAVAAPLHKNAPALDPAPARIHHRSPQELEATATTETSEPEILEPETISPETIDIDPEIITVPNRPGSILKRNPQELEPTGTYEEPTPPDTEGEDPFTTISQDSPPDTATEDPFRTSIGKNRPDEDPFARHGGCTGPLCAGSILRAKKRSASPNASSQFPEPEPELAGAADR